MKRSPEGGWNQTCIPEIIHGAVAKLGLLAQLSRPQLKHLADSFATPLWEQPLVKIIDVGIKPESVRNTTQFKTSPSE